MIDMKMDNLDDVAACLYRLNDAVKDKFEAYKDRIKELEDRVELMEEEQEEERDDIIAYFGALERYIALLDTKIKEPTEEKTND